MGNGAGAFAQLVKMKRSRPTSDMRRILCCLSLAGLFLAAQTIVHAKAQQQGQTGQQSSAATKSISGKVTSIGDQGKSFVV
jgi:hypothetical protein